MNKKYYFIVLAISILFMTNSCVKQDVSNSRQGNLSNPDPDPNDSLCIKFQGLKIKPVGEFTCGEWIELETDFYEQSHYEWSGPDNYKDKGQKVIVSGDANLYHRGWYKLDIYCDTCTPINDSIYIDVKLPQGQPQCMIDDNTSEYTSGIFIPKKEFTDVTIDNRGGSYIVEGNCDIGTLSFKFNEYWFTHKLEEGIYYTVREGERIFDKEFMNKVIVENRYQGERWIGETKQAVYVKYIGDKISITVCELPIKAETSSGLILNSVINGNLIFE